jgi:hypothetical protein
MAVPANPGASIELGTPVKLFRIDAGPGANRQYDVSADGRRFLFNTPVHDPSAVPTVVLDWAAELRR